jgi:hypothetical protein
VDIFSRVAAVSLIYRNLNCPQRQFSNPLRF